MSFTELLADYHFTAKHAGRDTEDEARQGDGGRDLQHEGGPLSGEKHADAESRALLLHETTAAGPQNRQGQLQTAQGQGIQNPFISVCGRN